MLPIVTDADDRMTIAVHIAEQGPFPFVVDTGAERTVISIELAQQLELSPSTPAQLHSISEASSVATVLIPRLSINDRVIENIRAPKLSRHNLGAVGILGIDGLQGQRVVLDFRKQRMTVMPSIERDPEQKSEEIVVRARNRFGRLVLADASADGRKVYGILDTGSEVSIGNPALLRQLSARQGAGSVMVELMGVTGTVVSARAMVLRNVRIGGVHIHNMPVAIADMHIFRQLGLADRPTLLLGMDLLRKFDRVSVDFANRRVRFLMPEDSERAPEGARLALGGVD